MGSRARTGLTPDPGSKAPFDLPVSLSSPAEALLMLLCPSLSHCPKYIFAVVNNSCFLFLINKS